MSEPHVLRVGIASYEQQKARQTAIARGHYVPEPDEPKVWFCSMESLAQVLCEKNQTLLGLIARVKPASLAELERLTGRKTSNLSRSLKTLERYGLVQLRREGKSVVPNAPYDRVEVQVDLLATDEWRRPAAA